MDRVLTSRWFLVSTAVCCGIAVAVALWVTPDSSAGARAFAALVALVASISVIVLIAWALAEDAPPSVPAVASPNPSVAERESPVEPTSTREALGRCIAEGRALRDQLEPGVPDARVDLWIEDVRQTLERHRAGVAGYFKALATRPYEDDRSCLDAHVARLETIARDML